MPRHLHPPIRHDSIQNVQIFPFLDTMVSLFLLDQTDVQQALAYHLQRQRKLRGYSREALAELSTVPASTIKKFERSGQISLRQFLLLWQTLDDLQALHALTTGAARPHAPQTIDDIANDPL